MVSIEEMNEEMNNREAQETIADNREAQEPIADDVSDADDVSNNAVVGSEGEEEPWWQQIQVEEDEDAYLDHDGGFQHPLLLQIKNNSPMVTSVEIHPDNLRW